MVSKDEAIEALSKIAAYWGGSIRMVSLHEFEEIQDELWKYRKGKWTPSPDDGHALHHETKEIVVQRSLANPGSIIHEMGHAFADKTHPDNSDEWEWFGWEICLAKKVGCYQLWSKNTRSYIVGLQRRDGAEFLDSWSALTARQKKRVAEDRIEHAKLLGIVTAQGEPVPIR